jgi:O-antigen/teichoic acid export membrane protein
MLIDALLDHPADALDRLPQVNVAGIDRRNSQAQVVWLAKIWDQRQLFDQRPVDSVALRVAQADMRAALLRLADMRSYRAEFGLMVLTAMLTAWLFVINFYYYGQQKVKLHNTVLFVRNSGWRFMLIAIVLLGIPLDLMLIVRVWLINLVLALALVFRDLDLDKLRKARASWSIMCQAVWFGVPLIPYHISTWALIIIIQYQLQIFSTVEEVANFSFGVSLLNIIVSFAVVIPQVLNPYIYQHWGQADQPVERADEVSRPLPPLYEYSIKYTGVVFIMATVTLIAFAPEVTRLMGGEKYLNTFPLLTILAAAFFIQTLVSSIEQRLLSTGQNLTLSLDYLITGGILIVIGSLFVWWEKTAYGAACALLLSYVLLMVMVSRQVTQHLKIAWGIIQGRAWLAWMVGSIGLLLLARTAQLSTTARGLILLGEYAILAVGYRGFVTPPEVNLAQGLLRRVLNPVRK